MEITKARFAHRTGKRFQSAVVVVVFVLVLTLQACTTAPYDVYVAARGNDSNDCRTPTRACLTVQGGIDKAATGSIIHVGAGTFSSRSSISVSKFVTIQGVSQTQTIITTSITDPFVEIRENVTATLRDLTIRGGRIGVTTYRNSHLIGDNLTIQSSSEICITNSARIDLTNATLSQCGSAIESSGIFNGNHLVVQAMSTGGISNWGAMNLQNTSVTGIHGPAGTTAVTNSSRSASTGSRLTFTNGSITNNTNSGLGNGARATTTITSSTINGNGADGVDNYGIMTLENVEVEQNGDTGITSTHGSDLTISRSGIANNAAPGISVGDSDGGASFFFIQNSTVTGNSSGIELRNTTSQLYYVTVAYNHNYGLLLHGGTTGVTNSIVELNTYQNCANIDGASLNTNAESLACDDSLTNGTLRLGILTLATGTKVIPLLDGSTAIDHADATCPPDDQRRYGRPHGAVCDVGAYEFGSVMALEMATPNLTPPAIPQLLLLLPTVTPTPVQGVLEIVTFTPTPVSPPTFTLKKNAFCRKGPDASFSDVTAIPAGDTVDILNVSEDGFWYFVYWQKFNEKCWVGAGTGDVNGDPTGLKVLTGPTLSAPEVAPASPTPPKAPCNPLIKVCP